MLSSRKSRNNNILIAEEAMRHGVSIFPCRAADDAFGRMKSPLTRRGYLDAVCDLNQLRAWARQHPDAMYGLPCAPNRLFVLDADRHGNGDGVAALTALFDHHRFDWRTVPCVRTPNAGLHVIFQRPAAFGKALGKIAPAIDIRDKGYVILPGSTTGDGRQYEIINGTVEQMAEYIAKLWLLEIPDWLRGLIEHKPARPLQRRLPHSIEGQRRQIEGALNSVRAATCGERNRLLHWAACRLGEAVAIGSIGVGDAEALLLHAGSCCGLREAEVRSTVRSGLHRTMSGACNVS
jgi:Bifunctional DNA primase/polymerase, N-terminal